MRARIGIGRNQEGEPEMRVRTGILLTVLFLAWTPEPTQAQWVATPYVGVNVSGDVETGKGGPGGSVGYFGGLLGFEFDFQLFRHFFKDADVASLVPDPRLDLDTDARTFMGNLVVPIRIQGATNLRPYGTAGIGVIRAVFDTSYDLVDPDQNNLGFNLGGGAMYSLNDYVGLRGDLRYFHAVVDEGKQKGGFSRDYGFWRATIGVTLGFPASRVK